jgi:hypothetical protein
MSHPSLLASCPTAVSTTVQNRQHNVPDVFLLIAIFFLHAQTNRRTPVLAVKGGGDGTGTTGFRIKIVSLVYYYISPLFVIYNR